MSTQLITRQDVLKKINSVIEKIPDDKLQYVWKEVDTWLSLSLPAVESQQDELLEFDLSQAPTRSARLPIRIKGPKSVVEMEVMPGSSEGLMAMECFRKNISWWNTHCHEIIANPSFNGTYLAISNERVFTGASYEEVRKTALQTHPDDAPYIFFLPQDADINGGKVMSVKEILETVQFVVDQEGKPQAAVLDMQAWMAVLDFLEESEDRHLVRDRINNWRTKEGWSRWEDFNAELESDAIPTMG